MDDKSSELDLRGSHQCRGLLALRLVVYLLLLGIACAAIWWIDRGAAMTNGHV